MIGGDEMSTDYATGGQLLVSCLDKLGAKTSFGVPGEFILLCWMRFMMRIYASCCAVRKGQPVLPQPPGAN